MADSRTRQRSRSNTDGIVPNHLPPQALELEEAVIGALMIEQDAFPKVSDILKADSFYDHRHQVIYEAVANLSLNQRPIDFLTVTEQLKSNGTLEEAGGPLYVTRFTLPNWPERLRHRPTLNTTHVSLPRRPWRVN